MIRDFVWAFLAATLALVLVLHVIGNDSSDHHYREQTGQNYE